ncbi:MAG: ATP synthase subunit B [Ruegeria sp.]
MSVDWLTVAAQIANFLVLLWLLKRFLYRPILDGIDAREKEISDRMSEAHRLMEEAQAKISAYDAKLSELEDSQARMAEDLRREAARERDAMFAEARRRIDRERHDFEKHLAVEKQRFLRQLGETGARVMVHLARKALSDLADETLEERIAAQAVKKLQPMADEMRKMIADDRPVTVTTHSALPEDLRRKVSDDLQKLAPGTKCIFDVDPTQPFGLILKVGTTSIEWTLDSYLDELETMMIEGLRQTQAGKAAQ